MGKFMNLSRLLLVVLFSCLVFSGQTFGEQLFVDNFEQDDIGAEPSKWRAAEGVHVAKVIEDPTDSENKVFETTNRLNGGDAGRHYVIGDESWTDYLVEWDWMIFQDGYRGIAFRYQSRDDYYLVDRRLGGTNIQLYSRKSAAWGLIKDGVYPNEVGVWYRCRIEVMKDSLIFKIKDREDGTPFSEIEPLLEGLDPEFDSGGVATAGIAYVDNVVVGETEDDLALAVQPNSSLSSLWGKIKSYTQ